MGWACNTYGELRNVQKIWFRNSEEKRAVGECKHRWEDDIGQILRTRVGG
jgi:hypothetical protein